MYNITVDIVGTVITHIDLAKRFRKHFVQNIPPPPIPPATEENAKGHVKSYACNALRFSCRLLEMGLKPKRASFFHTPVPKRSAVLSVLLIAFFCSFTSPPFSHAKYRPGSERATHAGALHCRLFTSLSLSPSVFQT